MQSDQFQLLNSWGRDWGVDGYCFVPSAIFLKRIRELYISKSPRVLQTISFMENKNDSNKNLQHYDAFKEQMKIDISKTMDNQLDSLLQSDLEILHSLGTKTDEQKILVKQLQAYFR